MKEIYLCPYCGSSCDWTEDCQGYGDPVKICYLPYSFWVGKKLIQGLGCGSAALWYCTNESCDWQYREPNNRRDLGTSRPDWMFFPTIRDTYESEEDED